MSKAGSLFKRCAACGSNIPKANDGTCRKCGRSIRSSRAYTWSYRIDVPSLDGKRNQRSQHGFDTEPEARAALDRLKAEISEGRYVEKTNDTVAEYLDAWLQTIRHQVSAGTWASYEGHVRNYLTPRIGTIKLQDLGRTTIRQALADLRDNGRIRGKGGLAPKTVHNVYLTLHVALEEAVRDQRIPRNPADDAHKIGKDDIDPETVNKADVWWGTDDIATFLHHVDGDELYAMWHVFLWTGARRGEVAAMRWTDLDLDAGTWTVTRQWRKGRDGTPELATLKAAKAGKPNRQRRTVALVPDTVAALKRHRAEQAKLKLTLGEDYTDHGLVFCLPNGQPMHPDGITQRFDRHVRQSGLRRIRLHDCRHSHATWCLDQGMPLLQVSRRLGHASIQITADLYGHQDVESQQNALGEALRRAEGQ